MKDLSSTARQIIFWLLIIAGAVLIYKLVNPGSRNTENIDLTALYEKIDTNQLKQLTVKATETVAIDKNTGKEYHVQLTNEQSKNDLLKYASEKVNGNVRVPKVEDESGSSSYLWPALYYLLPFVLIFGFWIFMLRQMQSGGNKALSFGKSRAKLLNNQQKRVTFKDVAGVEEAKEELQEIIEFLKEPQKFQKLGGRIPKGVLMMGPPGTGKTLLARAIAGEANVPFFSISGSDFVEMFVGVGASRVRDLFEQGKKNAPCIVFIDEIDAVGRHRGAGLGGGHDEREQTLNQLLVEMADFELAKDKVLMGAERKSMVISNEEKRVTAYHEAGHTLVGLKVPNADPVHKVTIIPRGMALGLTQQLPEGDRHNYSEEYLLGQIAILMGGRIAEESFLGGITTGASNDIERATELARAMVCEYGMSEMGPLTFGKKEEQIFLGREIAQHRDFSEETAIRIDQQVKKIITAQYQRARNIIEENRDVMVRLAECLLERETLDGIEIRRIVAGLPLEEQQPVSDPGSADEDRPQLKEPAAKPLKPILPPITGGNPAPA